METDSLFLLVSEIVERVERNAAAAAWVRNDKVLSRLMARARVLIAAEPKRAAIELELLGDAREFLTALGRGRPFDQARLRSLDDRMRVNLAALGRPVEPRSLAAKELGR